MTNHRIDAAAGHVKVGPVTKGQPYEFRATGFWRDLKLDVSADGYDSRVVRLFGLPPEVELAPLFALCGYVQGKAGRSDLFVLGAHCVRDMPMTGDLYVFANDVQAPIFLRNNSGFVDLGMRPLNDSEANAASAAVPDKRSHNPWFDLVKLFQHTAGIVSITVLVLLAGVALMMDFGRDIVRTVIENQDPGSAFWLVAAATYLASQAWFWPRRIIEANYGSNQDNWAHFKRLLQIWPRALGCVPFAVLIEVLAQTSPSGSKAVYYATWLMTLVSTAGFLVFVVFRHDIERKVRAGLDAQHRTRAAKAPASVFQRLSFWWPVVNVAFSLVVFACASFAPAWTGHWLGPSAIVFLALAGFLPYVALAGQIGAIFRLPMAFIIAFWVMLCSVPGDWGHRVGNRAWGAQPARLDDRRQTMDDAMTQWQTQVGTDTGRPLFVVATEGGASRAGLWTAMVLNRLQADSEKPAPGASGQSGRHFSDSVFAISSISGGSVGSVGWVKGLGEVAAGKTAENPVVPFAAADALGPAFATKFYPQALHTFLPAIGLADDAEGLERGWEDNWKTACPTCDGLDRPFLALYSQKRAAQRWIPLLMIGGAEEEKGQRIMTSPVTFKNVIDADDFFTVSQSDILQSTAIHNGARFPWVTSPGRITAHKDGGNNGDFHIVDGGYFDGSGIEAARQIAVWQSGLPAKDVLPGVQRPKVLIIIRYVGLPADDKPKKEYGATPVLNGFIGPLVGLFAARDGHEKHLLQPVQPNEAGAAAPDAQTAGVTKAAAVAGTGWGVCYITLFSKPGVDLPMDWVLSKSVFTFMDKGLGKSRGIQTIDKLLSGQIAAGDNLPCDDGPPDAKDKTVSFPYRQADTQGPASSAASDTASVSASSVAALSSLPAHARPVTHHVTHRLSHTEARHHHRR